MGAQAGADAAQTRAESIRVARAQADAFLAYLANVRKYSPHTTRNYGGDISSFLDWCERQGQDPHAIDQRAMRRFLTELVRAGYADKTINRRLSSLRRFYGWLEDQGVAQGSAVVVVPGRKLSQRLPRTMTDEDCKRLITTCDISTDEGLRDRAFLELLYATGARISEVAGLHERDIDFEQGQMLLFGKGSKERIVPVYESALDAIVDYLQGPRPRLAARAKRGRPQHLFVSTRGNDMTGDTLRMCFERHVRQAGLDPSLTPHAMRHTYATELLAGGADLKAVQELLGHASLDTTQIYTHLSVERLRQATIQAHPRA